MTEDLKDGNLATLAAAKFRELSLLLDSGANVRPEEFEHASKVMKGAAYILDAKDAELKGYLCRIWGEDEDLAKEVLVRVAEVVKVGEELDILLIDSLVAEIFEDKFVSELSESKEYERKNWFVNFVGRLGHSFEAPLITPFDYQLKNVVHDDLLLTAFFKELNEDSPVLAQSTLQELDRKVHGGEQLSLSVANEIVSGLREGGERDAVRVRVQ